MCQTKSILLNSELLKKIKNSDQMNQAEQKEINIDLEYSFQEINNEDLIKYAKNHLSTQGVLHCKENIPYAYLKVDDHYIHHLFPRLLTNEILPKSIFHTAKPNYFSDINPIGAHITVVYPNEDRSEELCDHIQKKLKNVIYTFELKKLFLVSTFNKKFVGLTIACPALVSLRKQFGLGETLNYRGLIVPFHITFAVSVTVA